MLRDIMLSIVLPLATHVWRRERQEGGWARHKRRRWQRYSSFETTSSTADDHGSYCADVASGIDGIAVSERGSAAGGGVGSNARAIVRDEMLAEYKHLGRSVSVSTSTSSGNVESRGDAVQRSANLEALPSPTTWAQDDDGFEMVEVPPLAEPVTGNRAPTGVSGRSSSAGWRVRRKGRETKTPRLRAVSTGHGDCGEREGVGGEIDGNEEPSGAGGSEVQLSNPALLALLLTSKSFLKHLPSLRQAANFSELWRQVRDGVKPP